VIFREHRKPDGGRWECDSVTGKQTWVENHKTVHQYSLDGVTWYNVGEAIPGLMRGLPLAEPEPNQLHEPRSV
jgi:hypothetical protein